MTARSLFSRDISFLKKKEWKSFSRDVCHAHSRDHKLRIKLTSDGVHYVPDHMINGGGQWEWPLTVKPLFADILSETVLLGEIRNTISDFEMNL